MEILEFFNVGRIDLGVVIFMGVCAKLRIIFLCT